MIINALQTARKGSKSVPNKNLFEIHGKPLYQHNLHNALQCKLINTVFISTDIPDIINAEKNVIIRPEHLCGDDASHYDAILHGLHEIDRRIQSTTEILVILLGNAMGFHPTIVDSAIQHMIDNPDIDSCISVGEFNMFNPYRAYKEVDGYLTTHISQETIRNINRCKDFNDKNAFSSTLFFNGSFWICRRQAILDKSGLLHFPWLGKKIKPIHQSPHFQEIDANWQIDVIKNL